MTQSHLFTTPSETQVGCRVKIIDPDSKHFGRTAKVEALAASVGSSDASTKARSWQVVFDWPMGGISARGIFQETNLEIISRL